MPSQLPQSRRSAWNPAARHRNELHLGITAGMSGILALDFVDSICMHTSMAYSCIFLIYALCFEPFELFFLKSEGKASKLDTTAVSKPSTVFAKLKLRNQSSLSNIACSPKGLNAPLQKSWGHNAAMVVDVVDMSKHDRLHMDQMDSNGSNPQCGLVSQRLWMQADEPGWESHSTSVARPGKFLARQSRLSKILKHLDFLKQSNMLSDVEHAATQCVWKIRVVICKTVCNVGSQTCKNVLNL